MVIYQKTCSLGIKPNQFNCNRIVPTFCPFLRSTVASEEYSKEY